MFVTVGKLHLSLHHAVPVDVCPPTAYTGHWQPAAAADHSQGEFYPGRARTGAAIIPRVMHRVSNKGSHSNSTISHSKDNFFAVTTHQTSKNTQSFYLHGNDDDGNGRQLYVFYHSSFLLF